MKTDIVQWIRWFLRNTTSEYDFRWEKMKEAADEIERLRLEIDRLKYKPQLSKGEF